MERCSAGTKSSASPTTTCATAIRTVEMAPTRTTARHLVTQVTSSDLATGRHLSLADPACPPQTSSSAPMAESASPRHRCVMGNISARTNRTRSTVGSKWTAARTTAMKTNTASRRAFCVTGRGTVRMALTKTNVVGPPGGAGTISHCVDRQLANMTVMSFFFPFGPNGHLRYCSPISVY